MIRLQQAFTLIEMIIFMVVISLFYGGIMVGYFEMLRHTDEIKIMAKLQNFATQRMELILGRKSIVGNINVTDPCLSNPSILPCANAINEGYSVSAILPSGGNEGTVVITATKDNFSFQLKTIIANYS